MPRCFHNRTRCTFCGVPQRVARVRARCSCCGRFRTDSEDPRCAPCRRRGFQALHLFVMAA